MKRDIALTAIVSVLLMFAIIPSFASSFSGQNAPDFHLADLSNAQHSLSDYKGTIVVLDFFSVGCSECQVSAKNVLVPLYNNYSSGDAKVQFLSVETTGASANAINSTYVNSIGTTWPILTGGDNLKNTYSTNGIPTVYVIDPAGKIVVSMAHPLDIKTLKTVIDNLLAARANATSTTTLNTTRRATPTPTNPSATPTASPAPSTSPTTLTNPTTTPTTTPSTSPTPTPTPSEATPTTHTSNTSKATQSRNTTAASSSAPSPSVASASIALDTQKENNASKALENCSIPLVQQTSLSTTPQKSLLCLPSLLTPILPSTVLAQAATMSAEACALSQGSTTPCVVPTTAIPTITLPAQTNGTASLPLPSVFEFPLLGLGAPTLLIGVLYLLLRRV